MIVRWPGKIKPRSRCDVAVSSIDFFPTFLAAARAPLPRSKRLDGESLIPLLTQSGTIKHRPLFWHFPVYLQGGNAETRDSLFRTRPGSVVRDGDWKLHEYFEDKYLRLPCTHAVGNSGCSAAWVREAHHNGPLTGQNQAAIARPAVHGRKRKSRPLAERYAAITTGRLSTTHTAPEKRVDLTNAEADNGHRSTARIGADTQTIREEKLWSSKAD